MQESRTYLGEWHSIAADPDASQDLVTMATDVPIGRTWPEILVRDFSTGVKVSEVEDKPSSLPADIHHLVASNTPVKDNGEPMNKSASLSEPMNKSASLSPGISFWIQAGWGGRELGEFSNATKLIAGRLYCVECNS